MTIEYLETFRRLGKARGNEGIIKFIHARHDMCRKYSFAIPTLKAIKTIAKLSPLVEMGAGTGYWTMLLRNSGAEVLAYDKKPGAGNKYKFTKSYTKIEQGTEKVLGRIHPEFSLFLCWPNYNSDFAFNCLREFQGNKLIYIGENRGGCTGNDKFFTKLELEWELEKSLPLPQWPGIHDQVTIYRKTI
jgi:hypothetical protein